MTGILELCTNCVASKPICESSVDILHYCDASLGKRRNQRAQGAVVESAFGERDDVYVKTKPELSGNTVNDGLPRTKNAIQAVAAAESERDA